MCLGVPGKVITLEENPLGMTMGKVSFGGITKDVCMAYVPEVGVGDYVVVHVGFAISIVDEEEARRTMEFLREMDDLDELDIDQPSDPAGA
ncbi:MAG: HypC/HybG/HupF family hydrogenase formation chaperone [Longimicrobiales bacterium]